MQLTDDQKQRIRSWIQEGLKLSDIQKRLASEMDLHLTYMEMRFLMDDLSLQPKDADRPKEQPASPLASPTSPSASLKPAAAEPGPEPEPGLPGDVSVTVDQVTRPGAIVSGRVKFSDGKGAEWYLDQMGRLGVVPGEAGYKPSQADLMIFQGELQNELAKLGF